MKNKNEREKARAPRDRMGIRDRSDRKTVMKKVAEKKEDDSPPTITIIKDSIPEELVLVRIQMRPKELIEHILNREDDVIKLWLDTKDTQFKHEYDVSYELFVSCEIDKENFAERIKASLATESKRISFRKAALKKAKK
jgi:hypothetical protein